MKTVVLESPFAGDVERNLRYVRAAISDSLLRGEAPFASHALYTQPNVLDDDIHHERELGIQAGFVWGELAETRVVYLDLGISGGMMRGIKEAERLNQGLEFRSVAGWEPRISFLEWTRSQDIPEDEFLEMVDWWVEAWHRQSGNINQSLSAFLGMHPRDFEIWVADPFHLLNLVG